MRDFNFQGDASTSIPAASVTPEIVRLPDDNPRVILAREDLRPDVEEPLRPFQTEQDNDDESSNLPKLAAAAIVGILVLGGGLYAYETSSSNHSIKSVAMNSTAPAKVATVAPATPVPAPASSDAAYAPAPAATPNVVKRASADSTSSDPAINAPMTLTPDTAPAPQAGPSQSADAATPAQTPSQTAMQQPLTAPNVSGASSQPTSEVAANNASAAPATIAGTPAPADETPQPQQPATVQPQLQPQIQPQLQAPAQ